MALRGGAKVSTSLHFWFSSCKQVCTPSGKWQCKPLNFGFVVLYGGGPWIAPRGLDRVY